jgi:valyl-tRNA synthetase
MPGKASKDILSEGMMLKEIITSVRDARNKHQLKPKEAITLHVQTEQPQMYRVIANLLCKQVNANSIEFTNQPIPGAATVVVQKDKFFVSMEKEVNLSNQKEGLIKELDYLKGFLLSVEKKLNNERFVQSARPEVIELERKKKADAEAKIKIIEESLNHLN